ncbi:MAG TPA: CGNR zinc finger domain-containing protein [Nitrospiraceae bacterium]|nr:CGNR zinc finger domain-containing protein [Nitrospiraceae bacterium]
MMATLNWTKFPLVGSHLSLDFVNTKIAENGVPKDLLEGAADLAAWAVAVKLLDVPRAKKLAKLWQETESREEFEAVLRFRKVLHSLVVAIARSESVTPLTLREINTQLRELKGYTEVLRSDEGFTKRFVLEIHAPSQLLGPVAEAASNLLCYGNPAYVKKCENPACVLYFYDGTKNHSRRWCSMKACGNRTKVAAFYQRQRQQAKRQAKRQSDMK